MLVQHEKNPNPTKDQHFMVDETILDHIRRKADIRPGETVVEIGGGAGALTKHLVKGGNYVTVIEKDPYYAKVLREMFASNENVEVREGDALEEDFSGYDRIVANLPYTITEPFLVNLARSGALSHNPKDAKSSKVKSITLVLSQNSVRKMVAPIQILDGKSRHFNPEFGMMGTICHTFLDVEIDMVIPSEAFFPEPAVTSFLVNLTPKKKKTTVDRILEEMLVDKKGSHPSITRVYQTMLKQGKAYNLNKHKSMSATQAFTTCTSKTIGDRNVYDLTNAQLSQLIQDLIRNDSKVKGYKCMAKSSRAYEPDDRLYDEGLDDDIDCDDAEVPVRKTKVQKKAEEKYAYLYDDRKYNLLLRRRLEYMESTQLAAAMGV